METTLCYFTCRENPRIEWFFDSLHRECQGDYSGLRILVIDALANPYGGTLEHHEFRRDYMVSRLRCPHEIFAWSSPKPTPWQGCYRQTRQDWFAAANARNTAIALCQTERICFVDDLSVLVPGWLRSVEKSQKFPDHITLGAYKKVRRLTVELGEIKSYEEHPSGVDSRLKNAPNGDPIFVDSGGWLFGCSLVAPVEAFLSVNGFPESCDGMGAEDTSCGILLVQRGWKMRYVPAMLTLESDEAHSEGVVFKRSDYGISPNDKSHASLALMHAANGWTEQPWGGITLRELRDEVANGAAFPVPRADQEEWYTHTRLCNL